mgnify:FL=1
MSGEMLVMLHCVDLDETAKYLGLRKMEYAVIYIMLLDRRSMTPRE